MQELTVATLDLGRLIRPGDHIVIGQGTAEPQTLTAALVEQRARIGGARLFLGPVFSSTWQPAHADHLSFSSYGGFGSNQHLARAGVLDIVPSHVSQLPHLLRSGVLRCDVVLVQLSPPDAAGRHSFGIAHDYLIDAMRCARVVIAEINDRVPWTFGAEVPRDVRIDYVVRSSRPPLELAPARLGDVERRIAGHAAALIEEGAVLQTGIGAIPDAILSALAGHRDLGVHSGMIGDGIVELIERGVVNGARKNIDRGLAVAGVLFATERTYRFADRNPQLLLRPVTHTHNVAVMAQLDRFVAINSAIEVDISGQVNAELANGDYIGAVGGQLDFVRGALQSRGGRSIIALPATAKAGTVSRIVARIDSAVVTTPRSDADLIVTEFGVADLRGQSLAERARRLVAIAHPDFREQLARAAHLLPATAT